MPNSILKHTVVVFSRNYLPVSKIDLRRAISLLVTGKAEPLNLDAHRWHVRSPSLVLEISGHIRLKGGHVERTWKIPPASRREILRRDGHRCQYCGSSSALTIDHVLPRSRGGSHSWENVVAACNPCNSRKGDRTPEEAAMPLARAPKAPIHPAVAFSEQFWQARQLAYTPEFKPKEVSTPC